jgi:hypothetical protein
MKQNEELLSLNNLILKRYFIMDFEPGHDKTNVMRLQRFQNLVVFRVKENANLNLLFQNWREFSNFTSFTHGA